MAGTINEFRLQEGYFTTVETAKKLGIPTRTLIWYADEGHISKPNNQWRGSARLYYRESELNGLKEEIGRVKANFKAQQIRQGFKLWRNRVKQKSNQEKE